MHVALSEHFTYKNIVKITISPILMMIFTSLYTIVDGYFLSNYAGLDAYAGVNVIFPVIMVVGGMGFMFGAGGTALSSKELGEGNKLMASKVFTMMIKTVLIVGTLISVLGFVLIRPIAVALGNITNGTTEAMVEEAITYGRILSLGQVLFMTQNLFQSYFMVDEKPRLGFIYTILAGVTNMVFDFILIGVFRLGVTGAAIATILGYAVGSIFPLIHFIGNEKGNIRLVKTKMMFRPILKSCTNGSSEFVSNISSSVVGMVFNIQLLRFYGQNGVSAYGTLMYVSFVFVSIYIGYSIGIAPVVGYNFGAKNKKELSNVLKRSLIMTTFFAIMMFLLGEFIGPLFAKLFLSSDEELLELSIHAFRLYSFHFVFCGFSLFISSFFTALNNGLISALLSFLRTLVFQVGFVLLLPLFMGKEGIWWSIIVCEVCSFLVAFGFLFAKRKKYGYFEKKSAQQTPGECDFGV